jgi:hypothetical protein
MEDSSQDHISQFLSEAVGPGGHGIEGAKNVRLSQGISLQRSPQPYQVAF